MESTRLVGCIVALGMWYTFTAHATTIVPYKNLGALSDQCDALVMARVLKNYESPQGNQITFRSRLVVEQSIKGNLQVGEQFDVQKWEKLIDDKWLTMWGDVNLYENARYLLFLEAKGEERYHPICFAYYVFEEITMDGEIYLVPSEHADEFEIIELNETEPLYVYQKAPLIAELEATVSGSKTWDIHSAKTTLSISDFYQSRQQRAAPAGCTYLYAGSKKIRWTGFPDQSVAIHYVQGGAVGCSSTATDAHNAIVDLQNAYPGIQVVDAGTVPPVANCTVDMSALGADYRSYIDNNFGSYRHVIIQFDDPCNEIANLSNCAGVLAIGGAYGIGSHNHDGESWATGKYGYVVLNNGFGACKCSAGSSALRQTLSHELSHALGLGHIASSQGSANMNPSCCNPISEVDKTCFAYTYPSSGQGTILPLELVSFSGESGLYQNELKWETAWESNVAKYEIERSTGGDGEFKLIGEVISKGDTEQGHVYSWFDYQPRDQNFYRLKTVDLDGSLGFSKIIEVNGTEKVIPVVFPTVTSDILQVRLPVSDKASMKITTASGYQVMESNISDHLELSLNRWPSGWYCIQISNRKYSETFRIFHSK